jgi:hypothetical protein
MKNKYHVFFDSCNGNVFRVALDDRTMFKKSEAGLYYYDAKTSRDKVMMVNTIVNKKANGVLEKLSIHTIVTR